MVPVRAISSTRRPVMRKPESTKKTSTPTKPPLTTPTPAWNATTSSTATARRPSMSARNRSRRRRRVRTGATSGRVRVSKDIPGQLWTLPPRSGESVRGPGVAYRAAATCPGSGRGGGEVPAGQHHGEGEDRDRGRQSRQVRHCVAAPDAGAVDRAHALATDVQLLLVSPRGHPPERVGRGAGLDGPLLAAHPVRGGDRAAVVGHEAVGAGPEVRPHLVRPTVHHERAAGAPGRLVEAGQRLTVQGEVVAARPDALAVGLDHASTVAGRVATPLRRRPSARPVGRTGCARAAHRGAPARRRG